MKIQGTNPKGTLTTWIVFVVVPALLFLCSCGKQSDIEIIRAVSLVPTQTDYAKDFQNWVKQVNKRGTGLFKIIYVGGPEAVPTFAQADAVRNGVVHMVFGPATYYVGLLPEVEALFASNIPPWETRGNGGVALMDKIHLDRMGTRYLARASFIEFHLFTRESPPLQENGVPDLKRFLIRGGPAWRSFINSLQATYVNIAPPDIYTALERNMIDGIAWPLVGLMDSSWDKHLQYRIDPGVFSSDVGLIFNAEKWDKLSERTRMILQDAAVEYELNSYHRFQKLTNELDQRMRESGMQIITLEEENARRYRELAANVVWQRLKDRAPENYVKLRKRFYRESQIEK